MAQLVDDEFGVITIRTVRGARGVTLRVAPDGRLRASVPFLAGMRSLKKLLKDSRPAIRAMLAEHAPATQYHDGMRIGKSHTLYVVKGARTKIVRRGLRVEVTLAGEATLEDAEVHDMLRQEVRKLLRVEAKHYLPRRLEMLASRMTCTYERVRFSHASTRWGSCSSSGTISLNIALMQLPFELSDYVLIHELCHTKQMNHSEAFWQLVQAHDPEYREHRRALKRYSPTI